MLPDIRYIVLLLTTACNLQCAYCYRGECKPESMAREVAAEALKLAAESGRAFHVQMTGGEPALEPELVEWVASTIRKESWHATVGLQTNGTLIDRSLARMAKRYDIQIGVSLDGPVDIQDELRGGAVSTFRGLKVLAEEEVPFCVTTVVTEQNVAYLGKLALILGGFGNAGGVGLDLLVRKGRADKTDRVMPPSSNALREGLRELVKVLRRINSSRPRSIKLREVELLKRVCRIRKALPFCHASRGESIAVHPDGSLYPCGQTVGDPEFYAGTIGSLVVSRLSALSSHVLEDTTCSGCPLIGRCPGDCPSREYYNDEAGKRLACVMYRTLWEEAL
jgi:uncharacterized protein